MAAVTPMQIRFTEADRALIEKLRVAYGSSSVAETLRRAIQVAVSVSEAEKEAIVKVSQARKRRESPK